MKLLQVPALLTALTAFGLSFGASADVAPDATAIGPLPITSAEYKLPATTDPDVISDRATELWARLYRPVDLSGGPLPLVIFLHGNHATCGIGSNPRQDDRIDYTTTGTCPGEYVVVPSHLGYRYLAERLASWGYLVLSINANRGITAGAPFPGDGGLNLARGRLILKHMQRLSEWNTSGGTPASLGVELQGKIDFSSFGMMGHSRGGEGIRAAYNQYRDVGSPWPARIGPVNFQAMFEIGPVDGQTSRVLNPDGVTWNVLLPMCDGDVSNLQGLKPFDRSFLIFDENPQTQKSTYTVWGADHNAYNTEWQVADSRGCLFHPALFPFTGESAQQQQTGQASVLAMFRGNVGPLADPTFNQNFNPQYDLPPVVTSITRVERGYTDSPNASVTKVFEDFDRPTGTNTYGFANAASNITLTHTNGVLPPASEPFQPVQGDDPTQRDAFIKWTDGGSLTYFQTNWAAPGDGRDASGFKTLDFRVARHFSPSLNPGIDTPTNFSIQLVKPDGTLSCPVQLSSYADLRGPVGGHFAGNIHSVLETARIPLGDFGADLTQIRGVRFTFDGTPSGAIYMANIRLSTLSGSPPAGAQAGNLPPDTQTADGAAPGTINDAQVASIRNTGLEDSSNIEIRILSNQAFDVSDELLTLEVGQQRFVNGFYPRGDTNVVGFTLTRAEFDQAINGDLMTVRYGNLSGVQWNAGGLDKSILNQ